MTEVFVTVNVEAGHKDAVGRMHGHSYVVEVWFTEGQDLVVLNAFAKDAASAVDHTMLEDSIGSPKMEDLGRWFLTRIPTATKIVVRRPTLGFGAVVER